MSAVAPPNPTEEVLTISRDLLEHFVDNPGCQDTFEGLASWWLLERDLSRREAAVRSATQYLVERGFVEGQARADGQVHYRLDTSKLGQIESFLGELGTMAAPAAPPGTAKPAGGGKAG